MGLEIKTETGEPKLFKIKSGVTMPTYVARTLEPVRLSRGEIDPRFPDSVWDGVRML